MQGSWMLVAMTGKTPTDKASGCKLQFEESSEELAFGKIRSARHNERFGRLTLKRGAKKLLDAEGKLIQTDEHPDKADKPGTSRFAFVPTSRIEADAWGELYNLLGASLSAGWHETAAGQDYGDGRPKLQTTEVADPNVVPDSNAEHMKREARRKLAGVA